MTQDYLADVRKPGEAKKAVADIPTPQVVKTGTNGDRLRLEHVQRFHEHWSALLNCRSNGR